MFRVIGAFFEFDKHIVDVDFHGLAHQWSLASDRSHMHSLIQKALHCSSTTRVV